MLTRADIAAALPPDILRLAAWYAELRLQHLAALAVMPAVDTDAGRDEVIPPDLTRAIRCDEAAVWLAGKISRWPHPLDWPHHWLAIYAGTVAPVEDKTIGEPLETWKPGEPLTPRGKAGRK
jgi:hypothetical protein